MFDVRLPIGDYVERLVDFLQNNIGFFFDWLNDVIHTTVMSIESTLLNTPFWLIIIIIALLAWKLSGKGLAIFSIIGLLVIDNVGLSRHAMQTLSLILTAEFVTLIIGLPLGIIMAKSNWVDNVFRPILDFMQTMPAFVYLIPAVMFFSLGRVPGVMATIIFSMPPMIRLTSLGIKQVPEDLVEAGYAFGATPGQMLVKVELPHALTTIMAGVNQSIMLALSMVVIAAMIGAGGLGGMVLRGVQRVNVGLGFESGLAVVILAILLDRITQSFGSKQQQQE